MRSVCRRRVIRKAENDLLTLTMEKRSRHPYNPTKVMLPPVVESVRAQSTQAGLQLTIWRLRIVVVYQQRLAHRCRATKRVPN